MSDMSTAVRPRRTRGHDCEMGNLILGAPTLKR